MDGGVTDTFHTTPGEKNFIQLKTLGVTSTANIQFKDGVMPSTAGTYFIYSIV